MTFKDFLVETYISELSTVTKKYDPALTKRAENEIEHLSIDALKGQALEWEVDIPSRSTAEFKRKKAWLMDCGNMTGDEHRSAAMTHIVKPLAGPVYSALVLLHEMEYKEGQIKKFYGASHVNVAPFLNRLADYCIPYLRGILFIRGSLDHMSDVLKAPHIWTWDKNKVIGFIKGHMLKDNSVGGYRKNATYYNLSYIELTSVTSLPDKLIAISRALNAVHDAGPLFYEPPTSGDDETYGHSMFEQPFTVQQLERLNYLNHRKMDKELQQELQNDS